MVAPFTSIFAIKLGASQLQVALLSSAPAMVSLLAMIPGAGLIDRQDKKKRLTFFFFFLHRLFFLTLATIPFFPPSIRAVILVTLVALMNFPGAISNVAWQSFISRIIPPRQRAEAFASRNKLMNLVGTAVTLMAGLVLDHIKFPFNYQIIFTLAFFIALIELKVFNRIEEPEGKNNFVSEAEEPVGSAGARVNRFRKLQRTLGEILGETRFIRYTLASAFFYFVWQVPWPLFNWYQVKVLGANNVWVSILNLMNTGGSLFGFKFWVNVIGKHGNLKALFYSSINIFIVPVVYAFSKNLYTIAAFNLLIGAIFSGVNLALLNTLLEVTPEHRKTSYIAYYNTAITAATIISPLTGVSLLKIMNFKWAFITCAVLRFLGGLGFLLINRLEEKRAEPTRNLNYDSGINSKV